MLLDTIQYLRIEVNKNGLTVVADKTIIEIILAIGLVILGCLIILLWFRK